MYAEILSKTYYGNTVQQWLIALLIIFGAFVIGKILYWISTHVLKKVVKKTKTKLDDLIIDMIEEPVIFALVLAGAWFAIQLLSFSEQASQTMANIFQFLIVMNIAWLITRLFDSIITEYLEPLVEGSDTDLDDQLLPIISKGIKAVVWILAVIIALNNAGYDVTALIAGLGIGGIALAMAAKDTVSNIFGGVTVITDRPFKLKEKIKVSGVEGAVEEIGIRKTRIRTSAGRMIMIPNSKFTANPIENISSEPSRKVSVTLGVSCDTSPEKMNKAMDILKKIAEKNENLTKKHFIGFSGFGDFTFDLSFTYYIKKGASIGGTKTKVNMEILKQFNKNKIEMPFPTQTVLLEKD